jgi:hypothetical protein
MRRSLAFLGVAFAVVAGTAVALQQNTVPPTDADASQRASLSETVPDAGSSQQSQEGQPGLIVYGDELPASTGWFLVPVLAEESTSVHVEFGPRLDGNSDQPTFATPVLLQHDRLFSWLESAGEEKATSVRIQDRTVGCCPDLDPTGGQRGRSDLSGWYGTAPETPLYVGLAAQGWGGEDNITIHAYAPGGELRAGDTLTETSVEAVNLFETARESPHVRVNGDNKVGGHDDVSLAWTADEGAFVDVAWNLDEGQADIEIRLPNGTRLGNEASSESWGEIAASAGPGRVEVSFTDASRDRPDEGEAYALFADLEVPYETLAVEEHLPSFR